MQQLYDAVRATGAENLVIIGGLSWAYDLSRFPTTASPATTSCTRRTPTAAPRAATRATWDSSWGFLTATDPVIVTEFGDLTGSATCRRTATA